MSTAVIPTKMSNCVLASTTHRLFSGSKTPNAYTSISSLTLTLSPEIREPDFANAQTCFFGLCSVVIPLGASQAITVCRPGPLNPPRLSTRTVKVRRVSLRSIVVLISIGVKANLVYDKPYPMGKNSAVSVKSYHRYLIKIPSLY